MKKRICLDARFFARQHAGLSRYTQALITHLMKLDRDTEYTVIIRPEAEAEYPQDTPPNWRLEVLDIPHYSLEEQTRLVGWLNARRFDLVYFTMFNHPLLYRRPYVVMIHDLIMHMYPPRPLWHPRTWVYRLMMGHAARAAKAIITNSRTTTRDVVAYLGVAEAKCHTIHLAVEESFRPATGPQMAAVKTKYGITKPYVLFVNSWRPHKGLPELMAAWSKIDHGDFELVLGGKSVAQFPEVKSVVEAAKRSDASILTPGFIDDADLPALYSGATLYVNPSHYEGFGFGLLEAMACGAPVVCSDTPCFREVGNDAVCYFKTQSADDLAQKISDLLADQSARDALVKKGRARTNDFSFQRMAQKTLSVFKSVLHP